MTEATADPFAAALSKAQGEFAAIARTREVKVRPKDGGPGYSFKYAPLDTVMAAVQPALSANGFAITHRIEGGKLRSKLRHVGGQHEESEFPLPSGSTNHQQVGGALTYGQRYNVRLLLNLTSEEDDDGAGEHNIELREVVPHIIARRDGIAQAKREIAADGIPDGLTPGTKPATPESALERRVRTWVSESIAAFGVMASRDEMAGWWKFPDVERRRDIAERDAPNEFGRLTAAYDQRLEQLPEIK